jgi:hypothetical protein
MTPAPPLPVIASEMLDRRVLFIDLAFTPTSVSAFCRLLVRKARSEKRAELDLAQV